MACQAKKPCFVLPVPSSTGDFKIADLHDKLVTLKNNYKLLHPGEDFNGIAIIQSDKNVEFKMLKKIMYSCAVAGYQNVNFAITPRPRAALRRLRPSLLRSSHRTRRPALSREPAVCVLGTTLALSYKRAVSYAPPSQFRSFSFAGP
jgi:hypothetical protein